jgi:methylglutaconyl-CoA hydratase
MLANTVPKMKTLLIEKDGSTALVTLNRPSKRNSLDQNLIGGLTQAFEALGTDESVRVIVLSGVGGHFCSGLYLNYLEEISQFGASENLKDSQHFLNLLLSIYRCPKPVIAKVQGYAVAGGCGIASACDLIIADESAVFGYTETRFGFIPALVASFLLRKVGESRARDLLLTARFISGAEALAMGLVNRFVSSDELNATVDEYVTMLTANSSTSLSLTKGMFENLDSMSLAASLNYARDLNALTRTTEDFKAGLAGLLQKK